MISILDLGLNVIAYRVEGRVEKADIERVFDEVDVRLAAGGRFNVYGEVASLTGMSFDALTKDVRLGIQRLEVLRRIDRAAVVTDLEWLRVATSVQDRLLPGMELRHFRTSEADEARAWVQSGTEP